MRRPDDATLGVDVVSIVIKMLGHSFFRKLTSEIFRLLTCVFAKF